MSSVEMIMKLVTVAVVIVVIYMIIAGGVTLAYFFRTGSGTTGGLWYQDRQKWIPKSWIRWAGYPAVFSNISGQKPSSTSVYKTLTNTPLKKCMLECDGANDRTTTKCGAFMYNPTSNTCTLYDGLNGLIPDTSSNVLYFVSGFDATVKQFFKNADKAPPAAGYAIVTNSSLETCAANCASNVLCTGFTFTGTSCGLYSDMDETKFTAQTGVTSYPLKDHTDLTSASDVKYWS
jgi:hypothetical protein